MKGNVKENTLAGLRQGDLRRSGVKAYFTVEASLVMPIVIGSIVFIMGFLLFWYNRCMMEQDLSMLTVKGSQVNIDDPERFLGELRDWQRDNFSEKYYGWAREGITYSRERNVIRLNEKGKMILGDRIWKAEVTGSALRMNAASFLRTCRRTSIALEDKK